MHRTDLFFVNGACLKFTFFEFMVNDAVWKYIYIKIELKSELNSELR